MTPRLTLVAGAASAALAVLVAGCGSAASPRAERPPPAAELVRQAQERIRLAGTGHVVAHQLALVGDDELIAVWSGDYDLQRHLWSVTGRYELADERNEIRAVGTADHTFVASAALGERYRGKWLLGASGDADDNPEPHLQALLTFQPGAVTEREGDGWSVPGKLPMSTVLSLLDLQGETPGEQERIANAEGPADVRLLVGPDRQVRELRITGSELDLGGLNLSPAAGEAMRDVAMSIQVSDLGREVTVTEPPAGSVVEAET
jgi:hypothetical protein